MMNNQITSGHTENGSNCNNGMEQAALLKAKIAVARVRHMESVIPSEGRARSARERWFAALEHGLCDWIERGGFAQEARGLTAEQTYIE